MIKAIFFDNDGTILSHELKDVPSSTRFSLQQLKKQGIKMIMATGRSYQELKALPGNDIEYDAYLLNNGQVCMDQNQDVLFAYPLQNEDKKFIIDLFNKKQIPIVLVQKDQIYTNMVNDYIVKALVDVSTQVPRIDTYQDGDIFQAVAYGDEETLAELKKQLTDSKMTKWHPYGADIYSKDGGKLASMKRYMHMFKLKDDEVMAFGDGENDLEMLQHAYISVAMGNASDEVKQVASFVTKDINDDGIYYALKHYKLI